MTCEPWVSASNEKPLSEGERDGKVEVMGSNGRPGPSYFSRREGRCRVMGNCDGSSSPSPYEKELQLRGKSELKPRVREATLSIAHDLGSVNGSTANPGPTFPVYEKFLRAFP
jgi:hypothetical protein